jgi:hypothetical protein
MKRVKIKGFWIKAVLGNARLLELVLKFKNAEEFENLERFFKDDA